MCSGSEAGSYLWLIDFVYHSTLGLRVVTVANAVTVSEIGVLLPNNQRQHRTLHAQKDVLPYALC